MRYAQAEVEIYIDLKKWFLCENEVFVSPNGCLLFQDAINPLFFERVCSTRTSKTLFVQPPPDEISEHVVCSRCGASWRIGVRFCLQNSCGHALNREAINDEFKHLNPVACKTAVFAKYKFVPDDVAAASYIHSWQIFTKYVDRMAKKKRMFATLGTYLKMIKQRGALGKVIMSADQVTDSRKVLRYIRSAKTLGYSGHAHRYACESAYRANMSAINVCMWPRYREGSYIETRVNYVALDRMLAEHTQVSD
jgi:hypothetical protein